MANLTKTRTELYPITTQKLSKMCKRTETRCKECQYTKTEVEFCKDHKNSCHNKRFVYDYEKGPEWKGIEEVVVDRSDLYHDCLEMLVNPASGKRNLASDLQGCRQQNPTTTGWIF
jgi:hypothetical protein